jgi:hypothetical protein
MLLIIPTIQKTVRLAAMTPRTGTRAPERVRDEVDGHAKGDSEQASAICPSNWHARPQVDQVVDRAERRGDRTAEEERNDLRSLQRDRDRDEPAALIDDEEHRRDEQEGGADREATAARDRDGVDPAGLRMVHDLIAHHDPSNEGRQDQGEQGCGYEHGGDRSEGRAGVRDEGHRDPRPGGVPATVRSVTRRATPEPGTGSRSQ